MAVLADIVVYTTSYCPYCVRAKRLLDAKKAPYREIGVDGDPEKRRWLAEVTRQRTVPQIFINGRPVGGFTDLAALDRAGELDAMLAEPPPAGRSASE